MNIKVLVAFSLLTFAVSCENEEYNTPQVSIEADCRFAASFEAVYKASCELLNIRYNKNISLFEKRDVIRKADMADDAGDVLAEMPEYDDVKSFVWPNGYGKF